MTEEKGQTPQNMITVPSTRFGDLVVPEDTLIKIPSGLIGFQKDQSFIMLEHKPPFSWLQSVEDPALAFVVVDGFEFGEAYQVTPPVGDSDIDLQKDDEYAILVIVTVRNEMKETTANLKAPVFVNLKNRLGVQVIFDNPAYSTRTPLGLTQEEAPVEESQKAPEGEDQS